MIKLGRPSPALVVAFIALAVALSGSAVALTGSQRAGGGGELDFKKVKPNSETGPDPCAEGTTGIFCGHDSISGYRGWKNYGEGYEPVTYALDDEGVVHLQGTMHSPGPPGGIASFILPRKYRPAGRLEFAVAYGHGDPCFEDCSVDLAKLVVQRDGEVYTVTADDRGGYPHYGTSVDGTTFSAK